MKKTILIVLVLAILLCITACTQKTSIGDSSSVASVPQVSPSQLISPTPQPLDIQVQTNENGEIVLSIKDETQRNEMLQNFLLCAVDENNIIIQDRSLQKTKVYNIDIKSQKATLAMEGVYDFAMTKGGKHVFIKSDKNGYSLAILQNDNNITTKSAPNDLPIVAVYENENGYGFLVKDETEKKLYYCQGEETQLVSENFIHYSHKTNVYKTNHYYLYRTANGEDTKKQYQIFDYKTNSLLVPEIAGYETAISISKDDVINGFAVGENVYGITHIDGAIVDITNVFDKIFNEEGSSDFYGVKKNIPLQLLSNDKDAMYFYNFPSIIKFDKATSQITTVYENIYSLCETNGKIYAVSINEETGDSIIKNVV